MSDRSIGWIGAILILITMLVPWGWFGVQPLVAGFIPPWVVALLVPYIVFVILMLSVLGRAEQ